MEFTIKKEPEVVITKNINIVGEENTFNIIENEYGDIVEIQPPEYIGFSKRGRPFTILVNDLILEFEANKFVISRKLNGDEKEYLVQNINTLAVRWDKDPHAVLPIKEIHSEIVTDEVGKAKINSDGTVVLRYKEEMNSIPKLQDDYFMISTFNKKENK